MKEQTTEVEARYIYHFILFSGICSLANSFLTDVNKSTILQLHNRFRRSFANGAQGVMVADMNKLVGS